MCNTLYIRLLLAFMATGIFFNSYTETVQRRCHIKSIVGSAKIRRNGTINWLDARVNMPIKERDALRTLIESEIELETSEGTIVKIGENSTLELDNFDQKENLNNTKVKIMNGSVVANVKKLINNKSNFEFETPTATAAIRGTVVGFDVYKENTVVKVYEGKVWVTPQGSKKGSELTDNQMTSIAKGQKKIVIEKMSDKSAQHPPVNVHDTTGTPRNTTTPSEVTPPDDDSLSQTPAKSDSLTRESTKNDTSKTANTVDAVVKEPIRLTVSSPTDGMLLKPSSQLTISGSVSPPTKSNVTVNGKPVTVSSSGVFKTTISVPAEIGDFELNITGENGNSTQTVTRTIQIKPTELLFEITNPTDGQIFKKTTIQVAGTVTPGAEVTAMSIKLPVSSGGSFSGQIPIPNEDGVIYLEFEAALDGKYQNVTRKIVYEPEYRFTLLSPQDGQEVNTTTVQIRGEVLPVNSNVTVLGRSLTVSPTGIFSGVVVIPDEEGEIELDFEIGSGIMMKTENKKIKYKKPRDISHPEIQAVLPLISDHEKLSVAVYDRTPEDEITFWYEVDGDKESEKGAPNTSFYLPLLPGLHKYTLYATDRAGNQSAVLSQNITWFGTKVWSIKPAKLSDILHLPPSGPDNSYEPVYTVEFSIEDLPDNDMRLIGSVVVVNKTTGETKTKKTFTDNVFSVDITLKNHTLNTIDIVVEDIKKSIKTKTLTINIQ